MPVLTSQKQKIELNFLPQTKTMVFLLIITKIALQHVYSFAISHVVNEQSCRKASI